MDEREAWAQGVFTSQPFSRHLGAELTAVTAMSAEITLPVVDHLKQQHGFVHGGVVSYLADNAITFAGGMALDANALTSELKINYVRPASGQRLVARATARSVGKRQAVCQCEVYAVDGESETLCALAQGTVVASGEGRR